MGALPAYVLAHAGDPKQIVPYLVEIAAVPLRWNDFSIDIYAFGNKFSPRPMQVKGITTSLGDAYDCEITVGDADDLISAADLATAKGLSGTVIKVWEAWLDPDTMVLQATVLRFRGRIETLSMTQSEVSLKCGPYTNFQGKITPRWMASANCAYTYKDLRCGYAGGLTTCLKTYADCTAHTNTARFGGFRNLPKPNTKIKLANGYWTLEEPK